MKVGIHTIVLRPEVKGSYFEQVMLEEVFPVAADTSGTVNRGGLSAIKSQHLLRNEADKDRYWWLIKDSEAMSSRSTQDIIQSMYATVREKLDVLAILESSAVFIATSSFDIGERDSLGRPVGLPITGSDL